MVVFFGKILFYGMGKNNYYNVCWQAVNLFVELQISHSRENNKLTNVKINKKSICVTTQK